MANEPIEEDFARSLLAGGNPLIKVDRTSKSSTGFRVTVPILPYNTVVPDPTRRIQAGYSHPGDKGDIWAQWVRQGRRGIAELIERWG